MSQSQKDKDALEHIVDEYNKGLITSHEYQCQIFALLYRVLYLEFPPQA